MCHMIMDLSVWIRGRANEIEKSAWINAARQDSLSGDGLISRLSERKTTGQWSDHSIVSIRWLWKALGTLGSTDTRMEPMILNRDMFYNRVSTLFSQPLNSWALACIIPAHRHHSQLTEPTHAFTLPIGFGRIKKALNLAGLLRPQRQFVLQRRDQLPPLTECLFIIPTRGLLDLCAQEGFPAGFCESKQWMRSDSVTVLLVGPLGLVPTSARLFIQPKDHKSASDFPG